MFNDPYVKSYISGGSLDYKSLLRFARDRQTEIKIVDLEVFPTELDPEIAGVEFVSDGEVDFVAYLNDNPKLSEVCKQYQKLAKPLIQKQQKTLAKTYEGYDLDKMTFESIGALYAYMIKSGISDNLKQAQKETADYGIDIKTLYKMLLDNNIQFFIKIKPKHQPDEFVLKEVFVSKNCLGIINTKRLHAKCLEEYCMNNNKRYLISCGFSSHAIQELSCDEIEYTDYQKVCLNSLFNKRG